MSVGFRDVQALIEPRERSVRLRFALENRSRQVWRASDHYCAGWQLFDPETGLFICEGDWLAIPADVAPDSALPVDLRMQLPAEPGRYHVYVSARSDRDGWFYQRDLPFLLLEVEVAGGEARLAASGVTTLGRLSRRDMGRRLAAFFTLPARSIWRHRNLVASLVRRDIAARYRGSFGDILWTVLHPLLLLLTYFFVFGIVLQTRFGPDPSRAGFVLYFLAGMLPWLPFSEAAGRSPLVVVDNRNVVKKLLFPVEILPVNLTLAGLVTQGFAVGVFLVLVAVVRGTVPLTAFWAPALVLPQVMFTLGLCWFLAALGVFVRDLGQVMGFLLTLWFFLTPICYPEASLPPAALPVLELNPLFGLVRAWRDILLESRAPALGSLAYVWALAAAVLLAGHAFFHKLRKSFPDVL